MNDLTVFDHLEDMHQNILDRKEHSWEKRCDFATHILRKFKVLKNDMREDAVVREAARPVWDDMFRILFDNEPVDFDYWLARDYP